MKIVLAIRTADRSPKRNYLGQTVQTLLRQGFAPEQLHIFPTDPNVRWLGTELEESHDLHVHVPIKRKTPNANGIRLVDALQPSAADWIALLEDDLDCVPATRLLAWLSAHDDPAYHVYRWSALPGTPLRTVDRTAARAPLREMRGSQAVLLRRADALAFQAWAVTHPKNWRPAGAPFQDKPDQGFDKLLGYWALATWPDQPDGLVAVPMLVNHIGRDSLLHSHGLSNDAQFAGARR